jgi:hypothetical protein
LSDECLYPISSNLIFYTNKFRCLDSQSTDDQSSLKTTLSKSLSVDELSADNYYKNAYYVFRALCKLSDRDIKDKANTDSRYAPNKNYL